KIRHEPLQYSNLLNFKYAYSLFYGIGIVLAAFLLPLVISKVTKKSWAFLILTIISFVVLNLVFVPTKLDSSEFPYFKNTFARNGFYATGISGTKYQHNFNF